MGEPGDCLQRLPQSSGRAVALGGTVTKDLHIINAFAADLPGRAVTELARAEEVRWISLDAPVVKTGTTTTCTSTECIDTASLKNNYVANSKFQCN